MADDFDSVAPALLGCIADDVTGATDLAINLVQGGMRVIQWLAISDPDELAAQPADAIVVALKTRSIDLEAAIARSLNALRVLRDCGCRRFFFKYCSTFDSTEKGNIGPVAEAIMHELQVDQTIFCPAFPRNGRTVYRGHLFVGDRLLNESGMENHPLNPMHDADLVRVLARQAQGQVGLLGYNQICVDAEKAKAGLSKIAEPLVITDCCDDVHLQTIAAAVGNLPLVTGGSGVARYLPDAYRELELLTAHDYVPTLPQAKGRSVVLSGSCSVATNRQVDRMRQSCPSWKIDVGALAQGSDELSRVVEWATTSDTTRPLLIYSTTTPEIVAKLQEELGRDKVATLIEEFHAAVACRLVEDADVRRLIVAGGETAGAVVQGLGVRALRIGPEICAGVPWTETLGEPSLALALKSGNFGDDDFFQRAVEMLP